MENVAVLMSTFNGAKYLKEQIDSILSQTGVNVRLYIRDDGSTDETKEILQSYLNLNNVFFFEGKNIGYTKSFLALVKLANNDADFFAFSDQDDVWDNDKMLVAVEKMKRVDSEDILYFSALRFVNDDLEFIGEKGFNIHNFGLNQVMVRSSVAGCTMVFNRGLASKISKVEYDKGDISGHDSWVLRLAIALDATLIYDSKPHINFRRHQSNTTQSGVVNLHRVLKELNLSNDKGNRFNMSKMIFVNFKDELPLKSSFFLREISLYKSNLKVKLKLVFGTKLNYSFFPVAIVTRIQVLLNEY